MEMPAASEVRRGCGRWDKKMKGPLVRSQAAGLSTESKRNVSALARGFSHFRRPFFGAALHLVGSDVFDMLRKAPLLAKRVRELPVAVSPELIHERHVHFGTRGNGTVEGFIHIFRVQEDVNGIRGTGRGRAGHAGKLVSDENDGVADSEFGVHDLAFRASPARPQ